MKILFQEETTETFTTYIWMDVVSSVSAVLFRSWFRKGSLLMFGVFGRGVFSLCDVVCQIFRDRTALPPLPPSWFLGSSGNFEISFSNFFHLNFFFHLQICFSHFHFCVYFWMFHAILSGWSKARHNASKHSSLDSSLFVHVVRAGRGEFVGMGFCCNSAPCSLQTQVTKGNLTEMTQDIRRVRNQCAAL